LALAVPGILILWVGVILLRVPSLNRTWDADVRLLAGVEEREDGRIRLTDIRDWRYGIEEVRDSTTWFAADFDPDHIVDLWMYEQILDGRGRIAHTFLVFEFAEGGVGAALDLPPGAGSSQLREATTLPGPGPETRYLGISVETRREVGEEYGIIAGMLRTFEVTHIWATERDLVRRRVEYLDYPMTRYRLVVDPEIRARIFTKLARETAELAVTPRWYHTALNNCTSSLIKYVNESQPGSIPLHYSYMFTGHTDDYLARLGYLERESAVYIDRPWLAENPLR
jgi:hypothetical protein